MTVGSTWDFASIEEKFALAEANYDTLFSGYVWTQTTITYSFPLTAFLGTGYYLPSGESLNYTALSQAAIEIAEAIIDQVSRAVGLEFVFDPTGGGDLKIGYQNMTAGGYANYPGGYGAIVIGEDYLLESDDYGVEVFIHELGHALGLKHPHDDSNVLDDDLDTDTSTIMSYNRIHLRDGNGNSRHAFSSHMLMDVLALEDLYGKSTKVSNEVYVADGNFRVIADYGGEDTIDLSTSRYDASDVNIIDLKKGYVYYDTKGGSWSSLSYDNDTQQYSNWVTRNADNGLYLMIITEGTTIENLVGSAVSDVITADNADNIITGGRGNDTINGGGGSDIVIFSGAYADYNVVWADQTTCTVINKNGNDGTDKLTHVEILRFTDGDVENNDTAPVLAIALIDRSAQEDTNLNFTIPIGAFTDPNGDALIYSATLQGGRELPSWLTFNNATRTFSGSPDSGDIGTLSIVVTASDGFESVSDMFELDITGKVGDDVIGTIKSEELDGTSAAEHIFGLGGNDTIYAGARDDVIVGGAGGDELWGEAGADTFAYNSIKDSAWKNGKFDKIMDFSADDGDLIDISGIDANPNKGGNQAFKFVGYSENYSSKGQIDYWFNEGDTVIFGYTDKDKKPEFYILIEGEMSLDIDDFLL